MGSAEIGYATAGGDSGASKNQDAMRDPEVIDERWLVEFQSPEFNHKGAKARRLKSLARDAQSASTGKQRLSEIAARSQVVIPMNS